MVWLASSLLRLVHLLPLLGAVNAYVDILTLRDQQIDVNQLSAAYDYVVVGGGQSGLVIATRLSENANRSVLVVEYGYFEDNPAQLDPSSARAYTPRLMFNVTTLPQTELNNKTASVYAASVVGGGSAINGMLFNRGSAEDYDNWERLGNPGWGWSGLFPYFKKSTTFTPPRADLAKEFNVTWDSSAYGKGPIQATYPDWFWPTAKVQWKAWKEIGVPIQKEGAAGDAFGAFWVPSVVDQQYRRSYSRNAYYDPNSYRKNLNLLTGYRVNKILFNNQKRATAVTIQQRGAATGSSVITIKAAQEVIVCAGWLKTPQLLMWSGIGPKSLLDASGIKVVADLPGVGSNLQDHPPSRSTFIYQTDILPDQASLTTNATFMAWATELWNSSRKGPYSVGVGNAVATVPLPLIAPNYKTILAKIRSQNASSYLPETYLPIQVEGFKAQRKILLSTMSKSNNGVIEIPFSGSAANSHSLEKPFSRGTVLLNTTDPYGEPIVDYRTNENPGDRDVFFASFRFARKWMAAPSMQQLSPVESLPGANLTTDAQLAVFLANSTSSSTGHSCGTATMAPRELAGVVSPQLLVYGVSGLSVGDISIIPLVPSTHTCATVYAIAEKASDLIKARYNSSIPSAPTTPLASASTAATIDEA